MFLSLLACAIVNWPQSYKKSHEKAPDKTENRMPGVLVLNYLKSFALFFAFSYSPSFSKNPKYNQQIACEA